jgi:phosphate-selective porin OprO/OprP
LYIAKDKSTKHNAMKRVRIVTVLILSLFFAVNMTAQEKKFKKTVKINGRIQADYEFLQRDKVDAKFNGFEFRRVHLSAAGKISPSLKYKVETSFAHGSIGFRDVYIKYTNKKLGNFAVGSMAEPAGLNVATSSKYITFFERSMVTSLDNFRWGTGLHYENYGLLDGKLTFQMALTNNGSHSGGFKDANLEVGNNFVARLTSAPLLNKESNQVVHVGLNFASRPYKDLKFRAENHMGGKYKYVFPGATGRQIMGMELGTTFGSISVQGEYKTQTLANEVDKDYTMSSYYAMGSFFITGEHRPYKKGAFGRVKPKKDIDNGGFGAIELVARYSNMGASKDVADANAGAPDQINNISAGFNWYLTSHARIMYNYILTDDKNDTLGNLSGHLIRVAIDF